MKLPKIDKSHRQFVLVNNAGVLSVSTIEEIAEDEWDRLIDANLKGPFLMCRAALPEFRKAGGGICDS